MSFLAVNGESAIKQGGRADFNQRNRASFKQRNNQELPLFEGIGIDAPASGSHNEAIAKVVFTGPDGKECAETQRRGGQEPPISKLPSKKPWFTGRKQVSPKGTADKQMPLFNTKPIQESEPEASTLLPDSTKYQKAADHSHQEKYKRRMQEAAAMELPSPLVMLKNITERLKSGIAKPLISPQRKPQGNKFNKGSGFISASLLTATVLLGSDYLMGRADRSEQEIIQRTSEEINNYQQAAIKSQDNPYPWELPAGQRIMERHLQMPSQQPSTTLLDLTSFEQTEK